MPTEAGFYLWYILDLNYLKVGMVQVICDRDKHLQHLRENPSPSFYLYQGGFENRITYTMYHQAHDALPPMDENYKPLVDGWIPFDMRTLDLIKKPIEKLVLKRIPRA
jgi:hypothetical protein